MKLFGTICLMAALLTTLVPSAGQLTKWTVTGAADIATMLGYTPANTATSPLIIYESSTVVNATSSSSVSNVVSFTIPGGSLGTNKECKIMVSGDLLQNTSTATNLNIWIGYGATTNVWVSGPFAVTARTIRMPFVFTFQLAAVNSTSAQVLTGTYAQYNSNTSATTGEGVPGGSVMLSAPFLGTSSVNSSSDQTLTLAVQWASASASCEFKVQRVEAIVQ